MSRDKVGRKTRHKEKRKKKTRKKNIREKKDNLLSHKRETNREKKISKQQMRGE